ncbi:hypothetical protein [Roseateles amylovorans]|uniref:Uncharacterized protein n=1 Tax=Roseateles amylovorans TaxID=2978473 RepID=A0ABY6B3E4_9BURK|nr:hypothetical protein [Roseateles amylovorans]UXH79063.1 hypothetical protein N4261_03765 [Roseateles amylovorans]
MKIQGDAPTTNPPIGGAQPSNSLPRTSPGESGAARPPGGYELSGLTAATSRRPSLPLSAGSTATKRPGDDADIATDQPARQMRRIAVLPTRTGQLGSDMPAQASQIGAISAPTAGASPLGGRVIDIPGLTMHSQVPTKAQSSEIEAKIKDALQGQHGPVQVFGYHVTTQENATAIRNQGFSADANRGLGGGVAGMNIHGPGLYMSNRPVDDYVKPDKTNVMYAVVAPQGAGFKEGKIETGKSWDAVSNAASAHDGDFVNSLTGDRKVNPGSISKVALVPIATIRPSMSQSLLDMQPGNSSKPAPAKTVSPELHDFLSGAVEKHQAEVQAIHQAPNREEKLDQIAVLKDRIMESGGMPEGATSRLLMMDLKARYNLGS